MTALINYLFIIHFIFVLFVNAENQQKRILMDDQNALERIHQLEIKLQGAVADISSLKQEKSVLEGSLHDANTKISQLNIQLSQLQSVKTEYKGAVYTRWGRKDCPQNGTELVYSGTVGGSDYSKEGGPADYICLPHDPDFNSTDSAISDANYVSYLYGAEYEDNYFGNQLVNDDVPCAVCRAIHRSSVLMIPGKTSCYNGWHKEFYGRMATGANTHNSASRYICVDQNADNLEAGGADQNGKLLYAVRAQCGSLHCPPFQNNALITCVVCSN